MSTNQRVHDRDLINLIFLLIKDNLDGSERFHSLILSKIETFLTPILNAEANKHVTDNSCLSVVSSLFQVAGGSAGNSPLKYEFMLLSSLMQRQDDSCWELRLRLVIHILLRSLNVAEMSAKVTDVDGSKKSSRISNPILIECLTLPCLRILNHVCKITTNLSLLNSLTTNQSKSGSNQPIIRQSLFQPSNASASLNRFYSEPHDTNYSQSPYAVLNNNYLANTPSLSELDSNEFMKCTTNKSFYEKWLKMSQKAKEETALVKKTIDGKVKEETVVDPVVPLSPHIHHMKSKYFAAWRKYTLKKKKQNQQHRNCKLSLNIIHNC